MHEALAHDYMGATLDAWYVAIRVASKRETDVPVGRARVALHRRCGSCPAMTSAPTASSVPTMLAASQQLCVVVASARHLS